MDVDGFRIPPKGFVTIQGPLVMRGPALKFRTLLTIMTASAGVAQATARKPRVWREKKAFFLRGLKRVINATTRFSLTQGRAFQARAPHVQFARSGRRPNAQEATHAPQTITAMGK